MMLMAVKLSWKQTDEMLYISDNYPEQVLKIKEQGKLYNRGNTYKTDNYIKRNYFEIYILGLNFLTQR
jgi:hypothetical protein